MADKPLDAELVARVKKGDRHAFDLLVIRYQQRVVSLILRYVKDHSEALDVAQEAFIKAYRALPRFRGDSAFYTWLYRIAVNTAKNHLASASRRTGVAAILHQAIQDLPEDLRTALTLREMEGLSYEEIAEVMDCPIGTVRSRIFRAREAVDAQIKPLLQN